MEQYRKLIAALVGLALLLGAKYGVDLTSQQGALVDLLLALGTAFGVWAVPNTPPPDVQPRSQTGSADPGLVITIIIIVLGLLATSCVTPAKPKSFIEELALAEAGAQASLQTIGDLTCTKGYDARDVCLEPGKPLKPQAALELLGQVSKLRSGLKAAAAAAAAAQGDGVGQAVECLGATRTGRECLLAAQQVLLQLETYLANQGRP
jgi:hypothetical protein